MSSGLDLATFAGYALMLKHTAASLQAVITFHIHQIPVQVHECNPDLFRNRENANQQHNHSTASQFFVLRLTNNDFLT
jgi:hypothetical protein